MDVESKQKGHSYHLERTKKEKHTITVWAVGRVILSIICKRAELIVGNIKNIG